MSASIIPPPIVQSTYASPSQQHRVAQSFLAEKSSPQRSDRQTELEQDLQYLLDAQAEGLIKGLEGGGGLDDGASTGSTTPTARSVRSASGRRSGKPVKKRPGLRSARKGLYNTMLALSAVKDDELNGISSDLHEKDGQIEQIDEWEKKKTGLQEAASNVESNEETVQVQRLREQAESVETEIRDLERQLENRRVQHRKLMRQVSAVENEVQARMASYTNSLRLLEQDVQKFLSITPPRDSMPETQSMNGTMRESVWQLPPKRRTLSLAREQYTHDRSATVSQQRAVEREKDALEAGAAVWKDVVTSITAFENRMREDMRVERQSPDEATSRLKALLEHMGVLITELEGKVEVARGKEWNLLIAAIGAEVDALERGRELLEGVLGVERAEPRGEERGGDLLEDGAASTEGEERNGGSESGSEEIRELEKSFETARRARRPSDGPRGGGGAGGLDSEDEHPDPELLFSQAGMD